MRKVPFLRLIGGEKSAMIGSALFAAVGVDDVDAVDGEIVDEKEHKARQNGGCEQPRRAPGNLLHHSGQLEHEEKERVQKPHRDGAEPELCRKAQHAGRYRVEFRLEQGIIAEKAEDERCFLVRAEQKAEEGRGGKAAPRIACPALLARDEQHRGGENGPEVGRERQHAAEPQKGNGERAEHAAERKFMRFPCHAYRYSGSIASWSTVVMASEKT